MRKIVLLILAIIILFSISYAQTYGGFSEGPALGWSPRAMGMGGAFITIEGDVNGITYNPASIARLYNSQLFISYNYLGLNPESLGFSGSNITGTIISFGVPDKGMWASALYYSRISPDEELGVPYSENVLAYSIGKVLFSNLSVGMNIKRMWAVLPSPYNSEGFGIDFGVIFKITPQVKIGAVVYNIYNNLSWSDGTESYDELITPNIKVGLSYQSENLVVSGNVSIPSLSFQVGGEYLFKKVIYLRLGWNIDSPTFGLGFKKDNIVIDYALLYSLNLGGFHHRVGLSMSF